MSTKARFFTNQPDSFNHQAKNNLALGEKLIVALVVISLMALLVALVNNWRLSRQSRQPSQTKFAETGSETASNNVAQISPTIEATMTAQADLNSDGQVDENDAVLLKQAFWQIDSQSLQADLNGDDKVDALDYSLLVSIIEKQNSTS